jgi:tripartite-type tricarboxylate transporter receptor subunit TctC
MKIARRRFLHITSGIVSLPIVSKIARAEPYPARPVRLILGVPPGAAIDVVARLIAQRLSDRLGKPFVVENRLGGGGNIGIEAVVRAPPDGYTLLVMVAASSVFNFIRNIAPVADIFRTPLVMEVSPSFPATTVPEFIAYATANPGKINMASGGIGTVQHVAGELFNLMTGVNMVHVPYRDGVGPLFTDLIGGRVQVTFHTTGTSIGYIRAGKLRPLAVTTAARQEVLPGIATVAEFVPGYEASGWAGVGAPRNTPVEIIDKLNNEINAALDDPEIKARIVELGNTVVAPGSAADFGKFIAAEAEKWAVQEKLVGAKSN